MKKTLCFVVPVLIAAFLFPGNLNAQSGQQYTRTAIMNGNQVFCVFGNWGVLGQPADQANRGAWKNPNDGYLGDVSPLVGAEVKYNDTTTFHSVVTCPFYPTQRPAASQDRDPISNAWWTWQPVGGYFNANQQSIALSTNPNSWPSFWPDKLGDPKDPGWRQNPDPSLSKYAAWNGYFGKKINADLESYFVMDDNNDLHFNVASNNTFHVAFKPDANDPSRNGLGLVVRVRGMQWSQFLAKDNIFWLYEITNTGTTNYNRVAFGMLVGTYVGVTSTEDYGEYNNDWSFYDATQNITYTGNFPLTEMADPLWVGPVGLVGYAFLESPGNPYDGIDNDGDADSSSIGILAPKFTSADFDSTIITAGSNIVLINSDFSRKIFTVPNVDSVKVWTMGMSDSIWIHPGKTKVAEGNVIKDAAGNDIVNPNAYDGIDNNFNGLIDENYYLHFHQIKTTRTTPPVTLIDIPRAVRHIDYLTSVGTSPYSMIDERRDDRIDNNRNWNVLFDDVGRDGIPNTGDIGEGDGLPTSGYDNLGNDTGLPGEPHVDKTDVRESDQIGLTSFYYFAPSNQIQLGNDELLWKDLAPGYFDVPNSIINNRPVAGEDGDFIYGSGYFPLLAKGTERFSLALVYGGGLGLGLDADLADLLKHKKTVQEIYDANYQFPQPPDKPTLTAVPGDHQVTLYWDRKAEASVDPVLLTHDFEGYKIYKSTEPTFADIFTITDGSGTAQGYVPLKQYDIVDGIVGYFHASPDLLEAISAYPIYLGNDTGLQHSYVDQDVENGRRYYYAVVAYDKGDETLGILPSENSKTVTISTSGQVSADINVAVVTPNAKAAGYVGPVSGDTLLKKSNYATGSIIYQVVDPTKITSHKYDVEFLDSENDGIDNNGNGLVDAADSSEGTRTTSSYFVHDLNNITEPFISLDTITTTLNHSHQIPSTIIVHNQQGAVVPASAYLFDTARGSIKSSSPGSLPKGTYSMTYQYYPVWRSPNIQGSPYLTETKDADIFDGVELVFKNDWSAQVIDSLTKWVGGKNPYQYSFSPLLVQLIGPPVQVFQGIRKPSDYSIIFSDAIVDTSYPDPNLQPTAIPVNFRVYNETDSTYIKFIFADIDGDSKLSSTDELVFLEKASNGNLVYTWDLHFSPKISDPPDTTYKLGTGDRFVIKTLKPFRKGDLFEFTTVPARVDQPAAHLALSRVRAVPNPYVTASSFEAPLNPGITSGRGQRRIDFIHVPANATIRIFTARGDHVRTLHQDGSIEDGVISWDLKTEENLDIAFGVYFYIVESTAGNTTGKLAIIK
jgi:hypothetical protein